MEIFKKCLDWQATQRLSSDSRSDEAFRVKTKALIMRQTILSYKWVRKTWRFKFKCKISVLMDNGSLLKNFERLVNVIYVLNLKGRWKCWVKDFNKALDLQKNTAQN